MLALEHLYTRYGKVECLKSVNVSVKPGEIVAILGANGAGKSTTLKTISGLIHPTAGSVTFGGKNISFSSPEEIVRLGISHVPEGRKIFQRMTVRENLDLGAFLRRDKPGMAEDLENIFKLFPVLKKRFNQKAGTLSGGEQQMLAIGRALMARPSLLILDEPSLGLAPKLIAVIFEMIQAIHRQGKAILLVEQNVPMALKVASRAYVLELGSVVLEGSAEEIRRNPKVQSAYLGSF